MGCCEENIDKIQTAVFPGKDVKPVRYGTAKKEEGETRISDSQQYKMAGNSIVVDVLAAIFRNLFGETDNVQKTTLF